jgi:phosphomannomutase/phosphoglucomutase
MKVFGSSGTRGVANREVTPAFVLRVARAAATVWDADRVALARDTRTTGEMLADAAASGLVSVGADVDRLGVVPTPGAQAYAEREGVPAVVVTASHNPPEFNGLKLVGSDGIELAVDDLEAVEETLATETFATADWDAVGAAERIDCVGDDYVDAVLSAVDRDLIADADLTVALDPGHGAGALTSPEFFRRLGCRVVTVNAQPDGRFPGRNPEPVPDHLDDLGRLVRASDADVGVAHDGDADRAIFYDERGEYVEGDATLAALAAAELSPGDVTVSAVNVSQRLIDVVDDRGADIELTQIGSTNIITRIEELLAAGERVPVAGEGNGGVLFPDYRLARDGAYTAARFLELIADRPVSDIVAPYDDYRNVRANVDYDDEAERAAMLDAVADRAAETDADVTDIDGHRFDHGDAWALARPSGTEPLIRVYAEARDRDRAQSLVDDLLETMEAVAA